MSQDVQRDEHKSSISEASGAFAGSFLDAFKQPLQGLSQLAGNDITAATASASNESTLTHWAHVAGSLTGTAALFMGSTSLLRRLPIAGSLAPVLAGGGLGFLLPTAANEGLGTRLGNAVLGAGTVSVLEYGPKMLGAVKLPGALSSDFGKMGLSSAAAGVLNVQGESLLHTGQFAGAAETGLGALTWAGTGAAFRGMGKARQFFAKEKALPWEPATSPGSANMAAPVTASESLGSLKTVRSAEVQPVAVQTGETQPVGMQPVETQPVEMQPAHAKPAEMQPVEAKIIPTLLPGVQDTIDSSSRVMTGSDLDRIYHDAKDSIGRVETLAMGRGGLEGRYGTAFAVAPGLLATADHVSIGAIDITVFDSLGKAHSATVLGRDPHTDLAVLKLQNDSSHEAFKPLPIADVRANEVTVARVVALGFPNGWDKLFASPGSVAPSIRPVFETKLLLHGTEGNSGGPVLNLEDGTVLGVFKSGSRNSHFETAATPAPHLVRLLERLTKPSSLQTESMSSEAGVPVQAVSNYRISDPLAASMNLRSIFGADFVSGRAPEFFHSKVKTTAVELADGPHDLTMKMQYLPTEQTVSIQPIAIDKAPISPTLHWPGTDIPIGSSQLAINLDANGMPVGMRGTNDPRRLMQKGFDYRGVDNYLATLEPQE